MGMKGSVGRKVMKKRNGKQQYDNVLFLAESVVKKQRENTEEKGTT